MTIHTKYKAHNYNQHFNDHYLGNKATGNDQDWGRNQSWKMALKNLAF